MDVIFNLVTTGISKLIDLVPIWMAASAEKKAEIEAKARSLVEGLDSLFVAADVKDAANTKKATDAIAGE